VKHGALFRGVENHTITEDDDDDEVSDDLIFVLFARNTKFLQFILILKF